MAYIVLALQFPGLCAVDSLSIGETTSGSVTSRLFLPCSYASLLLLAIKGERQLRPATYYRATASTTYLYASPRTGDMSFPAFGAVFRLWKKEYKKGFLLLLFDALFLIAFYFLDSFLSTMASSLFSGSAGASLLMRIGAALFALFLLVVVIGIYSFFKLCALNVLSTYDAKKDLEFRLIPHFGLTNLLLFGLFTLITILLNGIYHPLAPSGTPSLLVSVIFTPVITVIAILFVWYAFFVQIAFRKKMMLSLFRKAWLDLKAYGGRLSVLALLSVILFTLFLLVFALIGLVLKYTLFATPERITLYYGYYATFFSFLGLIALYLLFQYNRLYIFVLASGSNKT